MWSAKEYFSFISLIFEKITQPLIINLKLFDLSNKLEFIK